MNTPRQRLQSARRGSAYILVLGATMLVTTMAIGAAMVLSSEIQSQAKRRELAQTTIAAQSVLELGALTFDNSVGQRKAIAQGAAVVSARIGGVKAATYATAQDGSAITLDPADPFTMTSYAEGLNASQGVTIDVTPVAATPTSFAAAIHAGGSITISKSTIGGGPMFGATGSVTAGSNSTIATPVYSSDLIAGGTFSAGTKSGVDKKTMPSELGLEYYASRATPIAYASIPSGTIENCVMGPGLNPYGTADVNGLYAIDCGGKDLRIRDCRIAVSLIVWNVGTLTVEKGVHWATPNKRLPALGMKGTALSLALTDASIAESSVRVNLTPIALPFQGVGDTTTTSVLPNTLQGAFYVEGDVTVQTVLPLEGSLVCTGNMTISSARVSLNRPTNFEVPPGLVPVVLTLPAGVSRVTR